MTERSLNFDLVYNYDEVVLPEESVGECRNAKRCRNHLTNLGNGYCMECWDKGLDKRARRRQLIAMNEYKPTASRAKVF